MTVPPRVWTLLLALLVFGRSNSVSASAGTIADSTVKSLVERSGLEWPLFPPSPPLGGSEMVWGYASPNAAYFVLVSARYGEWGQFGIARYALVDSSARLLWRRDGSIVAPPAVSNRGHTALVQGAGGSVELLILDVAGKGLLSKRWWNVYRPLQRQQLEEAYAFSPEGTHFAISMNLDDRTKHAEEYNNTSLWWADLTRRREHIAALGVFAPNGYPYPALECTEEGAILRGEWRAGLVVPHDTFQIGSYRLNWKSSKVRRVVEKTVSY